jgi:hypothetical protein
MSYGFSRRRVPQPRKVHLAGVSLSKLGPAPRVERIEVEFHKQQESPEMNPIQKALSMTIARKSGDLSDADIAHQHQTIAIEMFPQMSVGKALDAFYKTEIGKLALGEAAQAKYREIQKCSACGDPDIIEKTEREEPSDKDDAGDVRGGPKVRHADNAHARRKKPATSHDGYTRESDDDPNGPMNDQPATVMGERMAKYCDSIVSEHSARYGVNKSQAYDDLLKSDAAFRIAWRAATALPASE